MDATIARAHRVPQATRRGPRSLLVEPRRTDEGLRLARSREPRPRATRRFRAEEDRRHSLPRQGPHRPPRRRREPGEGLRPDQGRLRRHRPRPGPGAAGRGGSRPSSKPRRARHQRLLGIKLRAVPQVYAERSSAYFLRDVRLLHRRRIRSRLGRSGPLADDRPIPPQEPDVLLLQPSTPTASTASSTPSFWNPSSSSPSTSSSGTRSRPAVDRARPATQHVDDTESRLPAVSPTRSGRRRTITRKC